MIKNFKDRETEKVFNYEFSRKFPPEIQQKAVRKLWMINDSKSLADLKTPKSNRLKELKGKLTGQHSIRINKQWRICFIWIGNDAYNVQIIDYH